MSDGVGEWTNDVHHGDAAETLAEMPESSVHCVMTSPPYYGLRDYGVDGQIGLEESLDEYVDSLLDVAEELRRVLRPDGSWWLNLGDSFAGSWGDQGYDGPTKNQAEAHPEKNPARNASLRRKTKMLVPHRVAIALQERGWIVRSDAVWSKPNPMPHPVKDRLHEHKEFVFHLTPEPDYWFDLDSIREPHQESSLERRERYDFNTSGTKAEVYPTEERDEHIGTEPEDALHPNGKNPGDVFEVAVKAFPEAHFAVYPPELCEAPIKSSCPPKVCAACGAPYERDVEDVPVWERDRDEIEREQLQRALERFDKSYLTEEHLEAIRSKGFTDADHGQEQTGAGRNTERVERLAGDAKDVLGGYFREFTVTAKQSGGWSQACDCYVVGDYTEPGIVLDPFAGAGTTLLVAKDLGRRFVGIDLNEEYVALAQRRVGLDVDQPELLLEDEAQQLLPATDGGEASGKQSTGVERPKVLNLYAGIGGNRHLWTDVDVTAVEVDETIAAEYQRQHPEDDVVVADAHEFLRDHYADGWDFIWASPPCQTHSKLSFASWHSDYAHNADRTPDYPDMRLYQEVILLDNLFDGDWVVENVEPYYDELLDAQRVDRHLFWSNYHIPPFDGPDRDFSYGGDDGRTSDREALEDWLGLELTENIYVGDSHDPAQVLRNAVRPEVGKHVFEARDTTQQQTLVAATDGGEAGVTQTTGVEQSGGDDA